MLEEQLKQALAECERLRMENTQLKAQLAKSISGALIELSPTASTSDKNSPLVNNQASSESKIELFRSLFRGREDIYALRWESAKNGRSGYSPACGHEWDKVLCRKPEIKCSECPNSQFLPYDHRLENTRNARF